MRPWWLIVDRVIVDSVGNALRTLVFLGAHPSVSVTEVSRHLGVAPSTAHRLLTVLKDFDYAIQDDTRRYRLGPTAHEVAARKAPWDIVAAVRPGMKALAKSTGETVNLLCLRGAQVTFLDGVQSGQPDRVGIRTGDRLPAYVTAGGKALLAQLQPKNVRALHPRKLAALTKTTITTTDQLLTELNSIRARGFGVNRGEAVDEVFAVGVAVPHPARGAVAALTLSTPAHRTSPNRVEELAAQLARVVLELTGGWS